MKNSPRFLALCLAVHLSLGSAFPQQPQSVPAVTNQLTLEDGTPVRLRIAQTISSADAQVGQTVDFEVLEEVKVGEIIVIPKGGVAWATVTEAQKKRRMGRGGKLNMNIDSVRLVSGDRAALRAVKEATGGGHVGKITTAIVITSIVFFPAAPLFLFIKGKDITIPKGTEITAYINGNTPLDLAKFQPRIAPPSPLATATTESIPAAVQAVPEAQLEISSTPSGAEIEIDGNFVGNTPSTLGVSSGEHVIVVKKAGYKSFEKKLITSSGKITITAELEVENKP